MDWISSISDYVFSKIPYSEKSLNIRRKFAAMLEKRAGELKKEGVPEHEIAGELLAKYGSLESACIFLGIDISIMTGDPIVSEPEAKKLFRRYELTTFLISLLIYFTAEPLFDLFTGVDTHGIAISVLIIVITFFAVWFLRSRPRILYGKSNVSFDAVDYLRDRQDTYKKRFINSVLIGIFLLMQYTLLTAINVCAGKMGYQELLSYMVSNIYIALGGGFLVLKNGLRLKWLGDVFEKEIKDPYKKHVKKLIVAAFSFVAAALLLSVVFSVDGIYTYYIVVSSVYVIAFAAINLFARRNFSWSRLKINKKRITVFASVAVIFAGFMFLNSSSWLTQPYISTIPYIPHRQHQISYNDENGVYTIVTDAEDFKILQLTDIHLGGSLFTMVKDHQALTAVYTLINETRPDLVIITGDLVFPMGVISLSLNNYTPVMQFASFMRNMGIPWVFAYGNHDTEAIASHTAEDLDSLLKTLSYQNTQNLLYPQVQPDITGRNNQLLLVENRSGELIQAIFVLDSNAYTGEGFNSYDYIHDDQVDWYEQKVVELNEKYNKPINSLLYFHIPLSEYSDAYELYKAGSGEVKYYYGSIGEKDEAVSCSEYPSRLFEKAVELGSTKAMFAGHDHYNNISLEYKGIRLTYSLSVDYLAMPGISKHTEQRGGTLVILTPGDNINIIPIKLEDIE